MQSKRRERRTRYLLNTEVILDPNVEGLHLVVLEHLTSVRCRERKLPVNLERMKVFFPCLQI